MNRYLLDHEHLLPEDVEPIPYQPDADDDSQPRPYVHKAVSPAELQEAIDRWASMKAEPQPGFLRRRQAGS
jgi:hypothetical protein